MPNFDMDFRKGVLKIPCQYLSISVSYGTKRISKCTLLRSSVCLESYNLMTVPYLTMSYTLSGSFDRIIFLRFSLRPSTTKVPSPIA